MMGKMEIRLIEMHFQRFQRRSNYQRVQMQLGVFIEALEEHEMLVA